MRSPKWFLFCLELSISLLIPAAMAAEVDPQLEKMASAWKDRQARIHSARFTVRFTEFDQAHSRPTIYPEVDVTHTYSESIVWAGARMRSASDQPVVNGATNQLEKWTREESFDGSKLTMLWKTPGHPAGQGYFLNPRTLSVQHSVQQTPLTRFLAPFDPETNGIDTGKWHLDTAQTAPGLVVIRPQPKDTACIWVDPRQDYSIVRYGTVHDGWPTPTYFVEHVHDTQHGWLPARWHWTKSDNGVAYHVGWAEVTHFEINPNLPPDAFDIPIPAGAKMRDERTDKK